MQRVVIASYHIRHVSMKVKAVHLELGGTQHLFRKLKIWFVTESKFLLKILNVVESQVRHLVIS